MGWGVKCGVRSFPPCMAALGDPEPTPATQNLISKRSETPKSPLTPTLEPHTWLDRPPKPEAPPAFVSAIKSSPA